MNNWRKETTAHVGGLTQIGYAKNSDLLLVLSHNGRGIFDCLTGRKIARDENDFLANFDETLLTVQGFAVLDGQEIKTSGLFGGCLLTETNDGWKLTIQESEQHLKEVYLSFEKSQDELFIVDDKVFDIRAFGFSETEKSFVVATTGELFIFSRAAQN